jgi:uncharacterized membrane protein YgaE (UPF0421/DUF939 family)
MDLAQTYGLKNKTVSELIEKINGMINEKELIVQENEDFKRILEHASEKLKELTDLIDDKYKMIENNYKYEVNNKQKIE